MKNKLCNFSHRTHSRYTLILALALLDVSSWVKSRQLSDSALRLCTMTFFCVINEGGVERWAAKVVEMRKVESTQKPGSWENYAQRK
jgi:hypothetical protein